MTDQEIQELLDNHLPAGDDERAKVYADLYKQLKNSDSFRLTPGFAHRVTAKLDRKKTSDRPLIWTMTLCGIGMGLIAMILLVIFGIMPAIDFSARGLQVTYLLLILLALSVVYSKFEKRILNKF